jgi:hypothetical protein
MGNGEPDRDVPGSYSTVEKATAHIAAPQQGVIEIGQHCKITGQLAIFAFWLLEVFPVLDRSVSERNRSAEFEFTC